MKKFDGVPPMVREALLAEASYSGMVDLIARHMLDNDGNAMDYQAAVDELSEMTIDDLALLYRDMLQAVSKRSGGR